MLVVLLWLVAVAARVLGRDCREDGHGGGLNEAERFGEGLLIAVVQVYVVNRGGIGVESD